MPMVSEEGLVVRAEVLDGPESPRLTTATRATAMQSYCHATISLSIRCAASLSAHWPLRVQGGSRVRAIVWSEGEAVFFEGRGLEHGRPPMPDEHDATYLVLHFQNDLEYS